MTFIIKKSSEQYLADNDDIGRFVHEYLVKNVDAYVTLKEIKDIIKSSDFKDIKTNTLKTRLERSMGVKCIDEK